MATELACFQSKQLMKADVDMTEEEIEISQGDLENLAIESELEIESSI